MTIIRSFCRNVKEDEKKNDSINFDPHERDTVFGQYAKLTQENRNESDYSVEYIEEIVKDLSETSPTPTIKAKTHNVANDREALGKYEHNSEVRMMDGEKLNFDLNTTSSSENANKLTTDATYEPPPPPNATLPMTLLNNKTN